MYFNLDDNGYVLSASKTPVFGAVGYDASGLDLSGDRIRAHRWDGKKLILDETRLAELAEEDGKADRTFQVVKLRQELVSTNEVILEGLEALFTATDVAGLFTALLTAKNSLADVLEARAAIREKIANLSKE